jgi:hypothetical protein
MGHPSEEDGITLIRVVDGGINTSNSHGVFKLYTSSHHQSPEEFQPDLPAQPAITPKKLFVIRGKLWWEIVPPKNCLLIWVGFSKAPMFEKIRHPHAFHFMTDYKSVTLPPPGIRIGRNKIYDYTSKN